MTFKRARIIVSVFRTVPECTEMCQFIAGTLPNESNVGMNMISDMKIGS